jgi:hypothetical protein
LSSSSTANDGRKQRPELLPGETVARTSRDRIHGPAALKMLCRGPPFRTSRYGSSRRPARRHPTGNALRNALLSLRDGCSGGRLAGVQPSRGTPKRGCRADPRLPKFDATAPRSLSRRRGTHHAGGDKLAGRPLWPHRRGEVAATTERPEQGVRQPRGLGQGPPQGGRPPHQPVSGEGPNC